MLFIEASQPPEVAVADHEWKVMALNRYNPALLSFKQEKKTAVFAAGANQAFAGALETVYADDTYQLVAVDSSTFKAAVPGQQLSPEQVHALYQRQPFHLLLCLEHFTTYFEQETVREKDEDGSVSKMAHYTLVARADWALYDSTGAVLDQVSLFDQELYNSRPVLSGLLAIGPSIGNAGEEVNRLARQTGRAYWERLSPKPIRIMRAYYLGKTMQPAAACMAAGKWQDALALLHPITTSTSGKEAGKAAYNLAVVYEAMGNVAEARTWARAALDRGNKLARTLLADLDNYGGQE